MSDIGTFFMNQGILGVLVLALAIILFRKDNDLTTERKSRIEDALKATSSMLAMQAQVMAVIEEGKKILAALNQREKP